MNSVKLKINVLLVILDRLFRGPPIDEATVECVRNVLVDGFLRDFIANPTKYKEQAGPSIDRGEWYVFYFMLRQLTPEILTHEELDNIDQALGQGIGEEHREYEEAERQRMKERDH